MMYFKVFFSGGLSEINEISSEVKNQVNNMFEGS